MKKLFYVSILVFSISSFVKNNLSNSTSRTITFSEHIAPIFYTNCTGCHHNGGVGPFSLINYQEAYNKRNEIQLSVISGYMPPWPPDTNYSRFNYSGSNLHK